LATAARTIQLNTAERGQSAQNVEYADTEQNDGKQNCLAIG